MPAMILKHLFNYSHTEPVKLPFGAEIIRVESQNDRACMWYKFHYQGDPNAFMETRTFVKVGTGIDFDAAGLEYIGTTSLYKGDLTLHIFEKK